MSQQKHFIRNIVESSERVINAHIAKAQKRSVAATASEIQTEALQELAHIRYTGNGYVFAATWDGESLAGPAKGRNVLGAKDVNGILVVQELIRISKNGGGYFTYHIPPSTGAEPIEKFSYVVGIPEWQWYIGAGFDLLELEAQVAALQKKSRQDRNFVLILVFCVIAVLILAIFLSTRTEIGRIRKNYLRFMDYFENADPQNSKIDTASMRFVEFEEIATAANEMVERRLQAEEALHESQARLSHHFQNTPLGSISFDTDFRVTEWNVAAKTIFGFSADEVVGRYVSDILLPPTAKEDVGQIWQLLLENKGGTRSTNENITKDGRIILCDWYNTSILGKSGKVIGVMSLVQDITERRLLEEQVNRSQKLEAVGQLTGGIAHDFNNLMAIMMGNLELVLEQLGPDTPLRKNIKNALQAVARGSTLTRQLLSFSRQQILSPADTDIQQLVEDTLNLLERTLGEDIQLIRHYDGKKIFVNIDGDIFSNALVNLALNARDAMPDGGTLTVRLTTLHVTEGTVGLNNEPICGSFALITVADTGYGMSKEVLGQVLEPFFTTKEVGKGSGLGLSMAYGFVTQSDGYLDITSTEGEGTTISIYLPLSDSKPAVQEKDVTPIPELTTGKTILLVEDDQHVRETTSVTLIDLGYTVLEAMDGASALAMLEHRASDIDLVLSDVIMPNGMSGIDLAKQIAVDYRPLKILLTSGYPDKIADQHEISTLDIQLLAKPFTRAQLVAAINSVSSEDLTA
ncbi:PAS domain S-box protein [Sneathiella aquimaris]|uniref:PAS domain S-box protein n=1 Tax=Sneathiella aquimaris TaxID=2599305 RepID=UPI002260D979|nr:cache domain-containing protein [Sneathiella aquimaris]